MDFVWKLYGNTYAVHVTVALVGVATLNLALPAPPVWKELLSKRRLEFAVRIAQWTFRCTAAVYIAIVISML